MYGKDVSKRQRVPAQTAVAAQRVAEGTGGTATERYAPSEGNWAPVETSGIRGLDSVDSGSRKCKSAQDTKELLYLDLR